MPNTWSVAEMTKPEVHEKDRLQVSNLAQDHNK